MLNVLANRTFRHLFAAQVIALLGTGLATVALGLLAWQLAGEDAGLVLGTALAIKMIAYVTLGPVAAALAERLPRRAFLVALDLIRAGVVLFLPFVTEVWQIYILIFFLQAASAGFTPAFQATIPDVLPDEKDYTNALSLLRLAEDLEQLLSPMLAAALLTVVSFPVLFGGTVAGFVGSALLVVTVALPSRTLAEPGHFWASTTKGIRIYLATPRLRGLDGDGTGRRCCRGDGLCQHGGAGAGPSGLGRAASGAGLRGLRCRVDCGRFPAAADSGAGCRPPRHDRRRRSDGGRGCCHIAGHGTCRSNGALGAHRVRVFPDPDAHRPHPEPIRPRGRSPCCVRRPIRTVACGLAGDLSAGGLAWVDLQPARCGLLVWPELALWRWLRSCGFGPRKTRSRWRMTIRTCPPITRICGITPPITMRW